MPCTALPRGLEVPPFQPAIKAANLGHRCALRGYLNNVPPLHRFGHYRVAPSLSGLKNTTARGGMVSRMDGEP